MNRRQVALFGNRGDYLIERCVTGTIIVGGARQPMPGMLENGEHVEDRVSDLDTGIFGGRAGGDPCIDV